MDDPVAVGVLERVGDLPRQAQDFGNGRGPRRPSFDVLHDQVVRPHVEQRADVGLVEGGDREGLVAESLLEGTFETLTATVRSSRVSRALYTSPIPPAPRGLTIS